ncbi:acyl--CoA ligase [Ruegeria pomeroyi]|nr:acyl--CoA ligase [Ruegeria pomeroyi]
MKSFLHHFMERQVADRPNAPALSDPTGAGWNWAGLDAAVRDIGKLLDDAGVRQGDRVMIIAENCASAVAVIYACSRRGAAVIPVNARQTSAEIDRVILHAKPAVIFATTPVSPDAGAHAARLGAITVTGMFGSIDMLIRNSDPEGDGDVVAILYTTGTTGDPKGVMLTHDNLRYAGRQSAELRGMTAEDQIYGVLPMTHVFGLASIISAAAYAGAAIRFEPRFSAARLLAALQDGVTLFSGVPQMHAHLMQYAHEKGFDRLQGSALRYVSSGAAPLDPMWKRKAENFYGVALQNGYGMTETSAGTCITNNKIGDPDTSVGRPLPGVELRIDQEVEGASDGSGEILTRGPHVMKGYFRNPEETSRVLDAEGWMHTGDLGKIDAEGRLHVLGRSKELIIRGGFNIYPPEVEAALNEHPGVIQSAVIGRRISGDEEVLAFCQVPTGSTLTPDVLRDFAAERLARYKLPARIVIATTLPVAPTGKILKHKLLNAFEHEL